MVDKEKKEIVISENRDFKGIWVHKKLYLSREYTPNEKFLLLEIYSLSNGNKKQCYANNKHFADFIGVKENTIQKAILKLEKNGHIRREYIYRAGTREIVGRIITLTQKFYDDFINETEKKAEDKGVDKNPQGGGQKSIQKYNINNLNNETVKTQSKDCAKVKTCSSKDSHDTNKARTREEMLEKEQDMVREFCKICFTTIDNATIRDAVARGFAHYMDRYRAYFDKVHPILTDKTLRKVCIALSEIRDDEFFRFDDISVYAPDENGVTGLREIIDEHFRREHKDYSDYSIAHFANSKYLTTIARGVVGY